jgi:SDR family mycofactocin-dependent oxidoreductase
LVVIRRGDADWRNSTNSMNGVTMNRLKGKVAYITGAARGQGRSHAIRFAEEGADIIAVDLCADVDTVPYPGATAGDLRHTIECVETIGQRIFARRADVRDVAALRQVANDGIDELGNIDIVVANAGVVSAAPVLQLDEASWQTVIDINLTGVWKTMKAVVPKLVSAGRGGSVILTSSVLGLIAFPNVAHYVAAKHGVTGLMKSLAIELAPNSIRVNSIHPGTVDTPMIMNEAALRLFTGGRGNTPEEAAAVMTGVHALPVPWVEPVDVSNAAVYLASDESRYLTGSSIVIDAGEGMPAKLQ